MATIPQRELRNNVGSVLRRAEAGECLTVTVNGRPVAELGPVGSAQRPLTLRRLAEMLAQTPVGSGWRDDLGRMRREEQDAASAQPRQ